MRNWKPKVEERTLILKEALKTGRISAGIELRVLSKEKQLNEIKSRFVSMASHEFRTPLSTIFIFSHPRFRNTLVRKRMTKRERHLKKIKDSVSHFKIICSKISFHWENWKKERCQSAFLQFAVREFIDDIIEEMKVIQKKDSR